MASMPRLGAEMLAIQHASASATPTRALLVDDHAVFRHGVRHQLTEHGIEIVGEASNGRDGVRLAAELKPDVVVMDTDMPVMNGIEATRIIVALPEAPAVLILASVQSRDVLDGLIAGARGFLLKDAEGLVLAAGVRLAAAGQAALAPRVAAAVVQRLRELEAARAQGESHANPALLTDRERQVLRLIAAGRDNGTIGKELYISSSTVKHHVAAILEKLGVENRVQAAVEAVRTGLA